MKKKTIMARWSAAKESMPVAILSAVSAFAEAREIILSKCGQRYDFPYMYGSAGGKKQKLQLSHRPDSVTLTTGAYDFFANEETGEHRDGIGGEEKPWIRTHVAWSLAEMEAIVAWLGSLSTGSFIKSWEDSQGA